MHINHNIQLSEYPVIQSQQLEQQQRGENSLNYGTELPQFIKNASNRKNI